MEKYLDPSLSHDERIQDLLSQMTTEEKISQMSYNAAAIPRLGIPSYNYWNEALHGVARSGRATIFPQAIGMASTWDPDLIHRIATAISDEARAKYHEAIRQKGYSDWYQGLTFWSPNVNIFRDPRWGRGQETWGEDPFLTGEMAAAFVRGLQGDDPRYLKTAACAKHYAIHSGPEAERHVFDVVPSEHDLYETYLPAFKKLVTEAKVEAVMGAYNRAWGEPCCASRRLLGEILRDEWGFDGHVVSDCGAVTDFHAHHKVTEGPAESAALAVKMGCDLACDRISHHLHDSLMMGLITEEEIDTALARSLRTRFRLGLFDPEEDNPYAGISTEVISCEAHRELSYQAACQSLVLLKNENNILPLGPEMRTIAVTGPNAASLDPLLGNYSGFNERMTTLLEGIIGAAPLDTRVEYRVAVPLNQPIMNHTAWPVKEFYKFDVVIVCAGLSPQMEGEESDAILSEGGDRAEIGLPQNQVDYLKDLYAGGNRIVLVLAAGSPIALGEVEELVEAILYVWYPGQEGGRAVGDVLFGKVSPSGKLPVTFPRSLDDLPPFDDYDMSNRTYKYSQADPLYPFGYGLSYTSFAYSDLEINGREVSFTVANTGSVPAAEVTQIYLSALESQFPVPLNRLVSFKRVELQPGERTV
ncbi:MAG: glycoside hydrolase family 3 C-terminal domain-containing protein, partial [Anaerolineales bacterium]